MTGGGGFNPDWDNVPPWYQGSEPTAGSPSESPRRKGTNPIVAIVAIVVAIAAVAGVGVTVIGNERDRPPPPGEVTLNGSDDTDVPSEDGDSQDVDPLDNARFLEGANIQPSDIGAEWRELKILQGDSGFAPCYHPNRPFWKVTADQYVGYHSTAIRPAAPAVAVVGMVTVLETKAEAQRRVATDGEPGFADCIGATDQDLFDSIAAEEGLRYATGEVQRVDTGTIDTVAWQNVAAFEIPGAGILPLYVDHLIMARGRLRVGVIVASIVRPFDPARRDLLVTRMVERLEKLAGTDLAPEG